MSSFKKATVRDKKLYKIPPAWKNVEIALNTKNKIQVKARDKDGKLQYIYHPKWIEKSDISKYKRLKSFIKNINKIKTSINNEVISLIIEILLSTSARIGNNVYEKKNKTYGITTLRKKHVKINKNNVILSFPGKRNKQQTLIIKDPRIIVKLKKIHKIPGTYLFPGITSKEINNLIHPFTCKDFRTYGANKECFKFLKKCDTVDVDKNIKAAIKHTSNHLGNTDSICKKSYISPVLLKKYKNNPQSFKNKKLINII